MSTADVSPAHLASAPSGGESAAARRLPVGAEVLPGGGVHFRVWAPRRGRVEVVLGESADGEAVELAGETLGYFAGVAHGAGPGSRYRFRLDGRDLFPDPASRSQPVGPHGPSRVVDPSAFAWSDAAWPGLSLAGQFIYEMHVGTFTREGTLEAATRELPELARLGVTVVELMPIAEFPGRFGWGYDGVNLFAPTRLYGEPDDLRRFVDRAHGLAVAVILDVVYNHVGPDGNYLREFSDDYFTDRRPTDWGAALNFDGPGSGPVREFFLANARYWIDEFHMDGLRLDATQSIVDESPRHIIADIARAVREAARGRATIIVAENEPQETRLARPVDAGGYGLDGLWNDDFHHSAMVAATGRREAYYTDYRGAPQELVSAAKHGYLYQGQRHKWQRQRRGSPALDLPPETFVTFVQNHDQIANSARGERLHCLTSPGRLRAVTALLLLMPGTPMLFQGQEFGASAPFLYFADHEPELAAKVRSGRADFLVQFRSVATGQAQALLADPGAAETFERCKLDLSERQAHRPLYELHRDLIRLRRQDPVLRAPAPRAVDGAVLADEAFLLRFFGPRGDDRLLLVNLGPDLDLNPAPEPLLAPPADAIWSACWSSEDVRYGGGGTPALESRRNWTILGHSAALLRPRAALGAADPAGGHGETTEEEETRAEARRETETGAE